MQSFFSYRDPHRMLGKLAIVSFLCCQLTTAQVPLNMFFPFNDSESNLGPNCDDCVSPRIPLDTAFQFFGDSHQEIIISPNGYISFSTEFGDHRDVCSPKGDTPPLLLAFWADSRAMSAPSEHENITYSERLNHPELFKKAALEIQAAYPGDFDDIEIDWIFIVTWFVTGMGASSSRNKYQLILATDHSNFFAILYYNTIGFTKSSYQGDDHAHVGYTAGDGNPAHTYRHPDSCLEAIKYIVFKSNYGQPGKFVFRLDDNPAFGSLDCTAWTPGTPLALKPAALAMEGHKTIKVKGPCLDNTTVECVFTEDMGEESHSTTLPGFVLDTGTAQCPTPLFNQRGKVRVQIKIAGGEPLGRLFRSSPPDGAMYVSSPSQSPIKVDSAGSLYDVLHLSWSPATLGPSSSQPLSVCMHLWDAKSSRTWKDPVKIIVNGDREVPNSGSLLLNKDQLMAERGMALLTLSLQAGTRCAGNPGSPVPFAILASVEDVTDAMFDSREAKFRPGGVKYAACSPQPHMFTYEKILVCPPTLKLALADMRFKKFSEKYFQYLKDSAECYMQVDPFDGRHESAACCYKSGNLMCDQAEDGTSPPSHPMVFHPGKFTWLHHYHDVLPWYSCCHVLGTSSKPCLLWARDIPQRCGGSYKPPDHPGVHGDPHFATIDKLAYTFNGFGEYVFVSTDDCQVQVRMVPYKLPVKTGFNLTTDRMESHQGPGTVLAGLAFKCKDSEVVELLLDPTMTRLQPIINKKIFKFPPGVRDASTGSIYVSVEQDQNNTDVYRVSLMNALFTYSLKPDEGTINFISASDCKSRNVLTRGLVGDCDGNPENDLKPANGGPAIPANSSLKDIHYKFGETWRVSMDESLFSYIYGRYRSYEAANNRGYQPLLNVPNKEQFDEEVQLACGNNTLCYFDFDATKNLAFAVSTVIVGTQHAAVDKIIADEIAALPPATALDDGCGALDQVTGGHWERARGTNSTKMLVCDEGFLVIGPSTVPCDFKPGADGGELPCCRVDCSTMRGLLRQMYCYTRLVTMLTLFGYCG